MTLILFKTRLLDRSLARHGPSQNEIREMSPAPEAPPPWRRRFALLIVVTSIAVAWGQPAAARAQESREPLPPRILVLRGVFEVFSLGMNDLARKLACCGYDVTLTSWSLALFEVQCAEEQPYVVIGHSLGGRLCAWVSRKLKCCGKRVPLLIIVDANLIQAIPANVDKCVHFYVTNPLGIFHGSPVRGESPCTEIVNWDVSNGKLSWFNGEVNHFNIDATGWVHQLIIDEIAKTFPPPAAMAIPSEAARLSEDALAASSDNMPPIEAAVSSSPQTRRIPWSPSRLETSPADREHGPTKLAWRPDRPTSPSPIGADSGPQRVAQ